MRCLITGPDGFVGSHCVEHLLVNTDWDILCLASWRHDGVPERLSESDHVKRHRRRLSFFTHDLSTPVSSILIDRMGRIDYIIHFAADSNVDRSIDDPRGVIENNVDVTLSVMDLARTCQPLAVIQISTDEVYGPAPRHHRHKEWEPIIPSNPYAASKAAQEAIATSYWRTYGVPVVITNTMNNIGERQSADKFLPMIIRSVLAGDTINIHAQADGDGFYIGSSHYLHARNHASACLHILTMGTPSSYNAPGREPPFADRPDRYNIVGDQELNNLGLAHRVASIMQMPLRYELVDAHSSRPGHDLRYALDGSLLRSTSWVAPVEFDESLERCVRWYMLNQEWLRV